MKTLLAIVRDRSLRNRILFVLFILVLTRVLTVVPIPGISAESLSSTLTSNSLFGLLNLFSGGGLASLSIVMLGVGPYITASIVMQLMTVLSPRLKEMNQEEGEIGRRKFVQYGRLLSLPFAVLQGVGLLALLTSQNVIPELATSAWLLNLTVITAASMLLMWMGEQINERGIGNGVSLIIFAGIVATLPSTLARFFTTFDVSQIPVLVALIGISLLTTLGIVFITEAERPVEVTYAKQARPGSSHTMSHSTYIPLRLNQAGVVPIIFAISILLFPMLLVQLVSLTDNVMLKDIAGTVNAWFQNQWIYGVTYFVLVFIFTYFYTAIIFDPEKTAANLQKNGAFISGFRPGAATAEYLSSVLSRILLVGAVFLGTVAILPYVVQGITNISTLAIGGTSLLIAISVVLDVIKKIDAQLAMHEY